MLTPLRLGIVAVVVGVIAAVMMTHQPPTPPEPPVPPATAAATQPALAAGPRTTLPSGLVIIDIAQGTGPAARIGDTVDVKYTGRLYNDGTLFDSTDRHGGAPFTLTLGQHQVIAGWDQGLQGMKVGGKRELLIPPDLGYGMTGSPTGVIPPAATLLFDIEMVKITPGV